jgi:hypothetical protein
MTKEDSLQQFLKFLLLPVFIGVLTLPIYPGASNSARTPSIQHTNPSDSQIEATIRTKLAKSKIGKDGFRFRVQRGVVTWEGSTSVIQHKGSATRMARAAGAVQVINNIQITGDARTKAISNLKKASVQSQ